MKKFHKEKFNKFFDSLYRQIIYRVDPNGHYKINDQGERGEIRGLFSHEFNRSRSILKDLGEAYEKNGHPFLLFQYAKLISDFGELHRVQEFITAPQEDWDTVGSTCGILHSLQALGIAKPYITVIERDELRQDYLTGTNKYTAI